MTLVQLLDGKNQAQQIRYKAEYQQLGSWLLMEIAGAVENGLNISGVDNETEFKVTFIWNSEYKTNVYYPHCELSIKKMRKFCEWLRGFNLGGAA